MSFFLQVHFCWSGTMCLLAVPISFCLQSLLDNWLHRVPTHQLCWLHVSCGCRYRSYSLKSKPGFMEFLFQSWRKRSGLRLWYPSSPSLAFRGLQIWTTILEPETIYQQFVTLLKSLESGFQTFQLFLCLCKIVSCSLSPEAEIENLAFQSYYWVHPFF